MTENDFEPTTPVVTELTTRSTIDPNEILLDNNEISEDETSEDYLSADPGSLDDDLDTLATSEDDDEDDDDYDYDEEDDDE